MGHSDRESLRALGIRLYRIGEAWDLLLGGLVRSSLQGLRPLLRWLVVDCGFGVLGASRALEIALFFLYGGVFYFLIGFALGFLRPRGGGLKEEGVAGATTTGLSSLGRPGTRPQID
jgi:hypothetical protein